MRHSLDSGLPEATVFIGGPGLDPDLVTRALDTAPLKASAGATPRWFWTTAGTVTSAHADDHLRAILRLAEAFERKRDAFPRADLRTSLFVPELAAFPSYSEVLVSRLRRFGPVTLNLPSREEPVVLPPRERPAGGRVTAAVLPAGHG
ncbi:MAG TPA: hypothetical protein VGG99_27585 [Acetobacteraceae bacterium]|jgi:hypothetical protein